MAPPSVSEVLSIPTRNGGISNAMASATNYFAGQQQNIQQLQMQQASDLSKAHLVASQYYPQVVPTIEKMMSNNPYARRAFNPQSGSLATAGQGTPTMGGNPNVFGSMFGAPGTTPMGTGILPTKSDGTADTTSTGLNMSPVATSMTMGGGKPPETTIKNPAAEQTLAAATSSGNIKGKASEASDQSKVSAAEAVGTKMGDEGIDRDASYYTMGRVISNAMADYKAVTAQQAGSGPIPGMVGNLATAAGMKNTGNIAAYKSNMTETAAAIAKTISPTSNGVQRLISTYLEGIPKNTSSDEQAYTTYGSLYRTGVTLKMAYDDLRQNYSDKQLDSMKPDDLNSLLDKQVQIVGKQEGPAIDDYFGKLIQNTQPRATFNASGRIPTQPNALSESAAKFADGRFGFNSSGSQNPVMKGKQQGFVNGKIYIDGKGNKATYQNGKWVEAK